MAASFWDAAFVQGCAQEIIENTPGLSADIEYIRKGGRTTNPTTLQQTDDGSGGSATFKAFRLDFMESSGEEGENEGAVSWAVYKPTADADAVLGPSFVPQLGDVIRQPPTVGPRYEIMEEGWDFTPDGTVVFLIAHKVGGAC